MVDTFLGLLVGVVAFLMFGLYYLFYEIEHACLFQPVRVAQYATNLEELGIEQARLPSGGIIWYDQTLCRDPQYKEKATILFVHGNSLNLDSLADALRLAKKENLRVAAVDFRGYGMADNISPSCDTVQQDALEAWIFVVNRCSCTDKNKSAPMILAGHSLGGAIATQLVKDIACEPILQAVRMPDQLVLLQSFADYKIMVRDCVGGFFSEIIPISCDWPTTENLKDIYSARCSRRPPRNVLIVQSPDDHIIPASHGQLLAASVPPEHLSMVMLPPTPEGDAHRTAIIRFWDDWSPSLITSR